MKTTARRPLRRLLPLVLIGLLFGYGYYALHRPLPLLQPETARTTLQSHTSNGALAWPSYGSAAVGVANADILLVNGPTKPLPIASTAKVLTALSVLSKKPLAPGQPGPTITLTDGDTALYNEYVANDGSVVPVASGEQITEYQMLEAMMLPSANNISDSLAIWAFGSLANYQAYANSYARKLGMTNTRVGSDASGLSPDTTSTARDLVVLGKAAMNNAVLAGIVSQSSADNIPYVGTVRNVNSLLGTDQIVGIKTGNTDHAGGVFLSASTTVVDKKPLTIVTAVLGAPNLPRALNDSLPLIRSAQTNFSANTLLPAKNVVGRYRLPWGGSIPASTVAATTVTAWNGATIPVTIQLNSVTVNAPAGQPVGFVRAHTSLVSNGASSTIILTAKAPLPSVWWRFTHVY